MPITDPDGYTDGHFQRVYEHLIKPAAITAGFAPTRADEVSQTNYIMIDVLKKTINSDMVICDLSTRNPNVLFELGIRQAFNKPVTLIKDTATPRIFDIQGLRTLDYTESLRIDTAESDRTRLVGAIKATSTPIKGDVNSLIEILGVSPAELPHKIELTERDSLMLNSLRDIADRVAGIERRVSARTLFSADKDFSTYTNQALIDALTLGHVTDIGTIRSQSPWNPTLSDQEIELLGALFRGMTSKEMAQRLNMAEPQIESALGGIYRKLNVSNKAEAVKKATELGLL